MARPASNPQRYADPTDFAIAAQAAHLCREGGLEQQAQSIEACIRSAKRLAELRARSDAACAFIEGRTA